MKTARKAIQPIGMPSAPHPRTPRMALKKKSGFFLPTSSAKEPRMGESTATHSVTALAAYPQMAVASVAASPAEVTR